MLELWLIQKWRRTKPNVTAGSSGDVIRNIRRPESDFGIPPPLSLPVFVNVRDIIFFKKENC